MKQAFRLLMITLGFTAISFAGVTVSSPTTGSTVGSPVHFVASASSSHPITAMRIYVDNVSVYVVSSSKIDTSVAMSSAKHNVVVQAGLQRSSIQAGIDRYRRRKRPQSYACSRFAHAALNGGNQVQH